MAEALSPAEFLARYQALLASHGEQSTSTDCVECARCDACHACTFCQDSARLVNCHYCEASRDCIECLRCRSCEGLLGCQHCEHSSWCYASSHLILCQRLSHCHYCLGCVGLTRRDYHILNQPYGRREYFKLLEQLTGSLSSLVEVAGRGGEGAARDVALEQASKPQVRWPASAKKAVAKKAVAKKERAATDADRVVAFPRMVSAPARSKRGR